MVVLLVIVTSTVLVMKIALLMSSVLLVISLISSVPLVKLQMKLLLLLLDSTALVADPKSTKQIANIIDSYLCVILQDYEVGKL